MADYLRSAQEDSRPTLDCESVQSIASALSDAGLGVVKIRDLESAAIDNALAACDGNRTHAALQLGISVRTLQRKLKGRSDANPADQAG
jgi:DNA-binding NtrC family response regulator